MIPWEDIETVLLDMDGTLLDLHFDNQFWLEQLPLHYAMTHRMSVAEAKSKLYALFEEKRGSLHWYCIDYWSDTLQLDIVQLKQETSHLIDIRPNVIPFLTWLKDTGRTGILVTNAHQKSLQLKLDKTGIDAHLGDIYSSHSFNAPKESQDFWRRFHKQHPFSTQSTLLIDDSEDVLRSAQQFGIKHLLCVAQPDSKQAPKSPGDFPAVACYAKLIESTPAGTIATTATTKGK